MKEDEGLKEWERAVDRHVDASSRWHSTQRGLVRTSDLLGDQLVMSLREAACSGKGGKALGVCASKGRWVLARYELESRLLFKLADTGRVVQAMEQTMATTLDLLQLRGSPEEETWCQQLQEERYRRVQLYHELLGANERLRAELGNEKQQVELQTLLKYGIKKYRDVLTPGELDVMSRAFDASVRLSGIVVASTPVWFAASGREWTQGRKSFIAGGEEACLRDVAVWATLQHPTVRKFYGAYHVGERPFMIHGLTWGKGMRSTFEWRLVLDYARGILYVHERGLVHESLTVNHLLWLRLAHKGVLSGLGLVWSSTADESDRAGSSDHVASVAGSQCPSRANDVMRLGAIVFQLLVKHRTEGSNRTSIDTSETKPLPDIQPDFVKDDEWHLLQGMCAADPADRITMLDVVHQIATLVDQEEAPSDPEESNTCLEIVTDVRQYQVASLGQTLGDMLDEAASWCDDADPELAAVQRPVIDRLMDVYEQLLAFSSPPSLDLMDQLSDIVRRFSVTLERREGDSNDYSYNFSQSSVGGLCASRTISGRNYGLHYDIDRLLREYADEGLNSLAQVHRWQPSWKKECQRQRQTLETLVEDPTFILEGMGSEAERSEALALLQCEAESTGLRSVGMLNALPPWFVPPHRVQLGKHLADGSFGAVYEGMYLDSPVVVKQVLTSGLKAEERRQFLQEADVWFPLNHENLIKLFGACHEGRPFFVCERAMRGTIVEYVRKNPESVWFRLRDAARGLQHLHDHAIVHGDLKGNNILVGEDSRAKVADFGLSFVTNQADSTAAADGGALGAFRWKAPEVLQGGKATFASDIYSFGMCIIETMTGRLPWGNSIPDAVVKHNVVKEKLLPEQPPEFNDEQWELVTRMCCYDPEERITAGTVVLIVNELTS